MARKKFGISPSVNKALTQTIQMAQAESSHFVNTEILLERIMLDPDNPRKHKISKQELLLGVDKSASFFKEKKAEYDGLALLASSIKKEGLFHPVIVVEEGDDFRLVAGERRFFASIMAGKKVIDARVFKQRPKSFDLKVIQWAENQSRKDLSLYKKLMNVQMIIDAFNSDHAEELTAIKLAEILGISRQQAQFYKAILSNEDLINVIKAGHITTMGVARRLTQSDALQIKTFLEGHERSAQEKQSYKMKEKRIVARDKSSGKGRKRSTINLGMTKQPDVVRVITETMLTTDLLSKYAVSFKDVDWNCFDASTKAFHKLIKILENETGVLA